MVPTLISALSLCSVRCSSGDDSSVYPRMRYSLQHVRRLKNRSRSPPQAHKCSCGYCSRRDRSPNRAARLRRQNHHRTLAPHAESRSAAASSRGSGKKRFFIVLISFFSLCAHGGSIEHRSVRNPAPRRPLPVSRYCSQAWADRADHAAERRPNITSSYNRR